MTEPNGKAGTKTLGIKLPPDLHAQFSVVTQMDGISLAEGVLRAVDLYVRTQSQSPDFAERAAAAVEEMEREAAARRGAVQALFGVGGGEAQAAPAAAAGRGKAK